MLQVGEKSVMEQAEMWVHKKDTVESRRCRRMARCQVPVGQMLIGYWVPGFLR